MRKIITILGTRPEIIRLSRIMPLLDKMCEHTIVHTTQNYDFRLSEIFFEQMRLRHADETLGAKSSSFGGQISIMLKKIEKVFKSKKPDKVVVLGDTNSGLCSIISERMGIPVFHLEAGNRCFDNEVPEEVNRKLIDSISTYNLPYTPGSRENLLNDGIDKKKIFTCGNPINEVMEYYNPEIECSDVLNIFKLEKNKYFVATFHRAETVDNRHRLKHIVDGIINVQKRFNMPVICSIHPRTADKLKNMKIELDENIKFVQPLGFYDFVKLEKNALCVLTDSGTVSEEACILGTPCVVIRNTTERPEILECGSAFLSGVDSKKISDGVEFMMHRRGWDLPVGYGDKDVSHKVVQFILGNT